MKALNEDFDLNEPFQTRTRGSGECLSWNTSERNYSV